MSATNPTCPECGCIGGHKWLCSKANERSELASATGCAAPSEIQAVIRELNAHIENLERLNRIGVSSSICDAIRQRQKLVAALCGAQHNTQICDTDHMPTNPK